MWAEFNGGSWSIFQNPLCTIKGQRSRIRDYTVTWKRDILSMTSSTVCPSLYGGNEAWHGDCMYCTCFTIECPSVHILLFQVYTKAGLHVIRFLAQKTLACIHGFWLNWLNIADTGPIFLWHKQWGLLLKLYQIVISMWAEQINKWNNKKC